MQITEIIEHTGSSIASSTDGGVVTVDGKQRLINNGSLLRRTEGYGDTYIEPDGTQSMLVGAHPIDGRVIDAKADEGLDVIEELKNG